jgi:hypothetical protein
MTCEEMDYLSAHAADFANFDWNALPLDRSNPQQADANAVTLFGQWERLNGLFTLRDSLWQGEVTFLDVFRAPSQAEAQNKLAAVTGWDPQQIDQLVGGFGFSLVDFGTDQAFGSFG